MDGIAFDVTTPAAAHEVVIYTLSGDQAGVIAALLIAAMLLAGLASVAPRRR